MIEFLMPSLGADMEDGTLVEWRKKPGDAIKRGDIIAEVDTQKGLIEIEVFEEGFVGELLIKEGTKVPVGTPMALINTEGTKLEIEKKTKTEAQKPEKKQVEIQPTEEAIPVRPVGHDGEERRIKASPLARKIAEDNNIDLSKITGTGENGAITKHDVEMAITKKATEIPEEKPLSEPIPKKTVPANESIRLAVAAAMSKSNREIPHYYLEKKIDMSTALAWLKEANKTRNIQDRLLPTALLIKSVAAALDEVPQLNGFWVDGLQLKNEINIGFVVSLRTGGIIVPTIQQADIKTVDEIMNNLNDLIPRARAMKLRSSELGNSTITLTNLGDGGADSVFGVIYPPQLAVIGFGNTSQQAFVENGMLGFRPVIRASLAGDHRATDGLTGSRFLASLNKHLQNPNAL